MNRREVDTTYEKWGGKCVKTTREWDVRVSFAEQLANPGRINWREGGNTAQIVVGYRQFVLCDFHSQQPIRLEVRCLPTLPGRAFHLG